MSHIHISYSRTQPATRYTVAPRLEIHNKPTSLVYCACCDKSRQARYAVVIVTYASVDFFCMEGRGCRAASVLAAKARKQHRNRSAGAKAGWVTRKKKQGK